MTIVVSAVVVSLACGAAVVSGPAHAATSADCTTAAATPLVQPSGSGSNPRVVTAVHCGAFLGPGSRAMVAVIASQGGCVSIGGWTVLALVGGGWQRVPGGDHEDGLDAVTVDGTTITEERSVHRKSDWFGCPGTGGSQKRTWNWDGSTLAPGRWKRARPAEAKGVVAAIARDRRSPQALTFYVASKPMTCDMQDGRVARVHCQHLGYPISTATLRVSGQVKICRAPAHAYGCDVGNPGEQDVTNTLRRGQSVIVGRFRCASVRSGMRCVVLRTGKGFLIGRGGVRRVHR